MSQQIGFAESEAVSTAIVKKVARREGVDPVELGPPLYEAIDPDAVDVLFSRRGDATSTVNHLMFSYHGYEVHVTSDGDVRVSDTVGQNG